MERKLIKEVLEEYRDLIYASYTNSEGEFEDEESKRDYEKVCKALDDLER